ncbi:hypothetical protein NC652_031540 [Populus alba x Populus x berolinensis]|nr:hypothetical protein NC652_031540 [Populus alba x Populus x berolinensis]
MASLESVCGQAYGAKQYQKLGIYTYCSLISLILYSSECEKTRCVFSKDVFLRLRELFRFAVPSAEMTCTRVSNVFGAGNPQAAKMAVWAVMVLAITEVIVRSTALFFCRHILGYASRSEEDILNHVADMDPFICLSAIVDRLQPVLSGKYDHSVLIYSASGVARGSGWKNGGAFVNLVGTPVRRCWLLLYTQGGRAFCLD